MVNVLLEKYFFEQKKKCPKSDKSPEIFQLVK